ncbi:MAG: acylphosphatase [Acidobacteriota bacterium]
MVIARRFTLTGRVQGVGFRYFTFHAAHNLGVQGSVRNAPGGEVEIEVQGEETAVRNFLAEIRRGPRLAIIEDLHVEEIEPSSRHTDFVIKD